MSTSILHNGITRTFSADRTLRRSINGEPLLIGATTINAISPNTTDDSFGSDDNHGSMLNPSPLFKHGFDTRADMSADSTDEPDRINYSADLNDSLVLPLSLVAGDMLLSSISTETLIVTSNAPCFEAFSALPVLAFQ